MLAEAPMYQEKISVIFEVVQELNSMTEFSVNASCCVSYIISY
jgi:hypothetical protein